MTRGAIIACLLLAGQAALPGVLVQDAAAQAIPAQALPPQALPPGLTPADQAAIHQVIQGQLNAFQHDDATAAYAFAAPKIQRLFPSADVFMGMVRRSYPSVYRPRQAEFSELALRDGELVQEVELVGPDGVPMLALYSLEKSPDGRWLITSCVLIPSTRLAA